MDDINYEHIYYIMHPDVKAGDSFELDLPMKFNVTRYTGGEEIPHKERYAIEYGPLLYAVLGAPNPLTVCFDPTHPEEWLEPRPGTKRTMKLKNDRIHTYMAYADKAFDELEKLIAKRKLKNDKKVLDNTP